MFESTCHQMLLLLFTSHRLTRVCERCSSLHCCCVHREMFACMVMVVVVVFYQAPYIMRKFRGKQRSYARAHTHTITLIIYNSAHIVASLFNSSSSPVLNIWQMRPSYSGSSGSSSSSIVVRLKHTENISEAARVYYAAAGAATR